MKYNREKGAFIEWLLMFLAISVVIFGILIPKSGRNIFSSLSPVNSGWTVSGGTAVSRNPNTEIITGSQVTAGPGVVSTIIPSTSGGGAIRLSTGNAAYVGDPMEEYIIIENRSSFPVNITGWRLENGKGTRTYTAGSQAVHYASDTAIIPQGSRVVSDSGPSQLESIVLKPNESAIVVTGGPGNLSRYPLVSFKENLCTGYLGETYAFPRGLSMSCVRPSEEPGINSLDTQCQDYIETMRTCHTPKHNGVDSLGQNCNGCVDGKEGLSSICTSYIKSHFSYSGCIANHRNDANFEGSVWHVYLHRPWEMWAASHETMSLYDASGNLVATHSY